MQKNELIESNSRNERKKEILLRENEKLKADFKLQRRTTINQTQLHSNLGAFS
jgi:hypothetical protein